MNKIKIKNLKEAADRIRLAVKNKENIILYGDSDMDGIASVVILQETIKSLGGNITAVAFPDRENDGYGINKKALEFLKSHVPALFITLDLGIANVKEVEIANSIGFEVIIVDHHQVLDSLPNAKIIVDPQQKDDEYPFKQLCNGGLTFKLCKEILGENLSENLKNSFLELTALATISDMVPQVDENRIFIEEGLRSLKNTYRPGLKVFLDILGQGEVVSGGYMKIISALNSAESINFQNESYVLLTNPSLQKCEELAENLLGKVTLKQFKIQQITQEVERRISQKPPARNASHNDVGGNETIIFEGDPAWKLTLAGSVASIICNAHEKPTFIFRKKDTESCGSVRSPKGTNSVEAMKTCKDILITYGGHPQASGFRLKNENLEEFKDRLNKYFNKV
ncbi:MAG: hypothetical protein A3C58_02535 [Candidatus Staskawiczbacteria bacterium RIFCSPHIGHO2_02_FULL_34_10]|uniref:Single-stranded-DNA-specific exonuclease RecJ n=2 Tax=Candidatus Staskawicziibacteriota TaxID=1817916 RepID=A0A1G2HLG9_9BACT|nr:MAG: hypothetical protein A2639_00220 [Candidatus Staskawiczbacteria bacterium RIFCSPHIGHO2_01_FULL_34_27]OGZ66560.1 MAG: hypothetical protein A3C58_02535 [Candidatus Staskawiczbacteria bacterium RIFCSPHIGHO2_02_FULL_34_10]